MITTEQHFNEAKDLLNFLCSWNNNLSGYVFRGHSDESFQLLPSVGNDSNLLIVFYVQIVPDDFVMQLHR
ncbi:hypothetical protein ACQV3I_24195, partial [Klebsiella pneumoniae]